MRTYVIEIKHDHVRGGCRWRLLASVETMDTVVVASGYAADTFAAMTAARAAMPVDADEEVAS